MERKYKINIPEPCNEDWNKMTPNDKGRFCASCSKDVVDFTNMMPDEIQVYFQQNNNVCGRFKNSQLNFLTIQIPSRVLYSQTQYHKMFLLALFVAMGTTLFSCADKNGNKQKIDKVEVVEDSLAKQIKDGVLEHSKDSLINIKTQQLQTKTRQIKFKTPKTVIYGEVFPNKKEKVDNEPNVIYEDNTVYGHAGISVYPEYAGGIIHFHKYIKQNFKFSKKSKHLNDTLIATFVIEKDGKLDSINVSRDLGLGTKEELTRILSNSKKWYAGAENGKPRDCKFQVSLTIKPFTVKKTFFTTKTASKIDTIEIKRITKYEHD
jgi:hypothetical protein